MLLKEHQLNDANAMNEQMKKLYDQSPFHKK